MPEQEVTPEGLARLTAFAQDLEKRQLDGRLKKKARVWKPTATSATQLGYDCERRIVYQRVNPWAAERISPELASIFEEGEMHERQVLRELEEDLGVKLRERNSSFRDERLDIVGAIDAEALVPDVGWVPVEVKGLAFIPGDDIEGVDLADAPMQLHRRYFAQLQIYLFLRGRPFGLFVFKSKTVGRWRCIPVALDLGACELLLQKAERVRDAVKAYVQTFEIVRPFNQEGPEAKYPQLTTESDDAFRLRVAGDWDVAISMASMHLPDRIADRSECSQCPFRNACKPSQAPVDPALLIDDVFLIEKINRHEEAAPARKLYNRLHEELRGRFEQTAGDTFYAGSWKIERKAHGQYWKLKFTKQEEATPHGSDDT